MHKRRTSLSSDTSIMRRLVWCECRQGVIAVQMKYDFITRSKRKELSKNRTKMTLVRKREREKERERERERKGDLTAHTSTRDVPPSFLPFLWNPVTNEKVRAKIQQAIGPHEDLLAIVKRRKLKCYGRVSRSSGLTQTISKGAVKGERTKTRQTEDCGKTTPGNRQAWSSPNPRG